MIGSGIGIALQKRRRAGGRSGVAGLPPAQDCCGLAIIPFQETIDPLLRPARILVDRQGHVDRGDKFAEIAPGIADDLLHFAPLRAPAHDVGFIREPAVKMPAGAFEGGAARAACVKGGAGTTMLIILAFGDDVFAQVGALMQSLGLANELPAEDPETGLDAVFVPVRRAAPEE